MKKQELWVRRREQGRSKRAQAFALRKVQRQWKRESAQGLMRMLEACGLPPDVLSGVPVVTMRGQNELIVENYQKLIVYQNSQLRLLTRNGTLEVTGQCLHITWYTKECLRIAGKIETISYQ